MELYTECKWPDWDRIVDIVVINGNKALEDINDENTYKILFLEDGEINIEEDNIKKKISVPYFRLLSNRDKIKVTHRKPVKMTVVYFKPTAIRDEFEIKRIENKEFEEAFGQSIYQDYSLIMAFSSGDRKKEYELPIGGVKRFKEIMAAIGKELDEQRDGFWPCRSRSHLFELLYYINYSFIFTENAGLDSKERDYFSDTVEYLTEHISEHVTLEKLTKELAINRNKLNEIFMEKSSLTCMNYFTKMRIDLAKLMLKGTELMIGEIGDRVGYPDPNYFTKVFKQNTGFNPTDYRKSAS